MSVGTVLVRILAVVLYPVVVWVLMLLVMIPSAAIVWPLGFVMPERDVTNASLSLAFVLSLGGAVWVCARIWRGE